MNIIHFNVRLAEGGAAGVALDLHQRALATGLRSHFVYGYGKSGKKSSSHNKYSHIEKNTSLLTAVTNRLLFPIFNYDIFGNLNNIANKVVKTSGPVILHFHVVHSYWLNFEKLVALCEHIKVVKSDVILVWTLHDHWSITGRCAFLDQCENWKTGCGQCSTLRNYPPVIFDRARHLIDRKKMLLQQLLRLGCQFISPSQHVAEDFNYLYGPNLCKVINNGIDLSTESLISDLCLLPTDAVKRKVAVVAHDLSYDGKTNLSLINSIITQETKLEVHTFGKSSPFNAPNVINHGFITDKRTLMLELNKMDSLLFSSKVDNYPLILCEALSIGLPVLATKSNAADEVLNKINGVTFNDEDILSLVQKPKEYLSEFIFKMDLEKFKTSSMKSFSGQKMLEEYLSIYQNPQLTSYPIK